MDLTTEYLGLKLRSPLVASASPLSGDLDGIRELEDAGAAAVVLPSLFEEQLVHESMEIDNLLEAGTEASAEAMTLFPELEDYNTGPDHYVRLVEQAKLMSQIPIIASLNGMSVGGWIRYAALLESAGADAIELNLYQIAADPRTSSSEIEAHQIELVEAIRQTVEIPIAIKIGPYFTALANFAWRVVEAGADGLVLFNRFYQPDIDPDDLKVIPSLDLSTSQEARVVLRWLAILRDTVPGSLAATTGIHTTQDVTKALLAGADVVMMASALIKKGPAHIELLEEGLSAWLGEYGYTSVDEIKGSMSRGSVPEPTAFERANYMKTLVTFSRSVRP